MTPTARTGKVEQFSLIGSILIFLLPGVHNSQCLNGTCGRSGGRLEIANCSVNDPSAICGVLPPGASGDDCPSNVYCQPLRHSEDCQKENIIAGTEIEATTSECNDGWEPSVSYQFLPNNNTDFYVKVNWNHHPNASTYTALALDGRKKCTSPSMNKTEFWFSAKYHQDDTSFTSVALKIIAEGTCSSTLVHLMTPQNCLILCPGNCSCLDERHPPPVNVMTTCALEEEEGVVTLNVSWEPVEDYLRDSPENTFHLNIQNSSMIVADSLKVKGQTSVLIRLRRVVMTSSYYVQVTHVICDAKTSTERVPISECQSQTSPTRISSTSDSTKQVTTTELSNNSSRTSTTEKTQIQQTLTTSNLKLTTVTPTLPGSQTTHIPSSPLTNVPGPRKTPTSTIPLTDDTNSDMNYHLLIGIMLAVATGTLVVAALLSALLITMKYKCRCKIKLQDKPHHLCREDGSEKMVLVLFSQASSIKDEMLVMEHVVKAVSLYSGVNCLYFDKPSVQTSVAEWVEGAIKKSDKVLLVVNKEFVKEWDSPKAYLPHGESLVYVARQVVHSFVMRDKQQLSKFALIFLRKEDQRNLLRDSLYLQSVKSFLIQPQAAAELESLVRFLLDVPKYTLPNTTGNSHSV